MSPGCRDMPIQHLVKIDEEKAYAIFRQFRWPKTQGEPVCPPCGVLDCYVLRRRRREYSVTSSTVFAFHKLSFCKMLTAIWMSVNAIKGQRCQDSADQSPLQHQSLAFNVSSLRTGRRPGTGVETDLGLAGQPRASSFIEKHGRRQLLRQGPRHPQ